MARVTVEDCLEKCGNRFELTIFATQNARALARGERQPLVSVNTRKTNNPTVIALREIEEGVMTPEIYEQRKEEALYQGEQGFQEYEGADSSGFKYGG